MHFLRPSQIPAAVSKIFCSNALILILSVFAITGCSVQTPVWVLSPGESKLHLSVGGPFVPGSVPTGIIPYTTAGYTYGINATTSFAGNVHLLSALFKTPGLDAGLAYQLFKENDLLPELTILPKLSLFQSFSKSKSTRLFPGISANASITIYPQHLVYTGLDYMMQTTRAEYFITPFIGYSFPVYKKFHGQFEIKWMAANAVTEHGVFEGESSIGGKGAVGFFTGVAYAF